jgi:hypothetical protein
MANALFRPTIKDDLCARCGEQAGNLVDPSSLETQMAKKIVEERPIDGVECLRYVNFQ